MSINHQPSIFSDFGLWKKYRKKTLFFTPDELEFFQKNRLNYIQKIHNTEIAKIEVNSKIPEPNSRFIKHIELKRSGTTSSTSLGRSYLYSMPHQRVMEEHHIWKLEHFNNLKTPGNVLYLAVSSHPCKLAGFTNRHGEIPISNKQYCSIFGPVIYAPCGSHNKTFYFYHNCSKDYGKEQWLINLDLAQSMDIKFVRCSPSILETLYYNAPNNFKFNCPVVLSEESLTPRVREIAFKLFTDVIDKMMCWDGGMGWFECSNKRKHVYDEFCYLEYVNNQIVSTDLHNEAMPFFRYYNGDYGELKCGLCKCGLYGNYFETFYGKQIESFLINDRIVSGRYISESLSVLFRGASMVDGLKISNPFGKYDIFYRIIQKENGDIDFLYHSKIKLNNSEINLIILVLNWIIYQKKENLQPINIFFADYNVFFSKETSRSKSLEVKSDYIKKKLFIGTFFS